MDLVAALATGFAGGFAMCRKDLSAVLPGVAIAISLVPPLGVVGVCAGQGLWSDALGALVLFLSNVVALVIAGSIVFTMGGYARDPARRRIANRRRAYIVVTVLAVVIAVPLAANSIAAVALARWSVTIQEIAVDVAEGARRARGSTTSTWSGLDGDPGRHDRRRRGAADRRPAAGARRPRSRASSASSSTSARASSTSCSERGRRPQASEDAQELRDRRLGLVAVRRVPGAGDDRHRDARDSRHLGSAELAREDRSRPSGRTR